MAMNPPRFPRDLLYVPARLELADEAGEVFLPALYPGSHEHADDQVRLGRMTDWKALEGGPTLGRRPAHVPPRRRRRQPARVARVPVGGASDPASRAGAADRRRTGLTPCRDSTSQDGLDALDPRPARSTPSRRGRAGVAATASSR